MTEIHPEKRFHPNTPLGTYSRDWKNNKSSRTSTAGGNPRRSMSTPANHEKPASKPFCFDFAKRNT
eukprot:6874736-Pyramimonas_sp.AAC.1